MTDERKPMTAEELAEIRRIWAVATPGPWEHDRSYDTVHTKYGQKVIEPGYDAGTLYLSDQDGAAIAKAPEHIAALLAEVERLQQELDEAKNALREAESEADTAVALSNGECPSCGGRVERRTPDKHSSLQDAYFQCASCGDVFGS